MGPSHTAEDWAKLPRTAVERRAEARRLAARRAADQATQLRAERRGTRMLRAVGPSLAKASGSMAIGTLVSRVTGFLLKLALVAVLGIAIRNDAYTIANTLPNMVLEFLLGGVLTSVAVPVLIRAQRDDTDSGDEFTHKLLTLALLVLGIGTILATIATPLLVTISISDQGEVTKSAATALGYLLLPEIFFYGLSALLGAVLNTRNVFGPTAWAPVLANVIGLVACGVYALMPGEMSLNPSRLSDPKLLVIGLGTTLGIVAQAIVVLPYLRKIKYHFRWRLGWDPRLTAFGGLAAWTIGYVAVNQVAIVIINRVATSAADGGATIFSYSWLLIQLPYGVIGAAVSTAVLPRMSRAAAEGNVEGLVGDLSFAARMCTVLLGPISALMTVLGPEIGVGLFSVGQSGTAEATRLGLALTTSAFCLLPFTITLLQLRVFYAMQDARTPTLIMAITVVVKIPLFYLCPVLLDPQQVIYGLTFVNGFGFVVGALVGQYWLIKRLGRAETRSMLITIGKTFLASVWAAGAALLIARLIRAIGLTGAAAAWPTMILGSLVGAVVLFAVMTLLRVAELRPAMNRITGIIRRR